MARRPVWLLLAPLAELLLASLALAGCAAQTAPARHVEIVAAPPTGDVQALVKGELERAQHDGRKLLVYMGAPWCEPCRRFHEAAQKGLLDAQFANLRLYEFDNDRDSERMAVAGYVSQYIPLFARPGPDGRASGKQIEGGVKGDGAVAQIAPRLSELLQ